MQLLDALKKKFNLTEDKDVASLLGKDKSTVSKWRASGEIPARAEREIRRLLDLPEHRQERELTAEEVKEAGEILATKGVRPAEAFDIPRPHGRIPIISWAQAGPDGFFEDSFPTGSGFGEINRPYDVTDPNAYALIISGDSMSPKFEPGDVILVSPNMGVRTGDYAVVRLKDGTVAAKRVKARNGGFVLESVNPDYPPVECSAEEVVFLHRIVWVKQRG